MVKFGRTCNNIQIVQIGLLVEGTKGGRYVSKRAEILQPPGKEQLLSRLLKYFSLYAL